MSSPDADAIREALGTRPIVLIGMMGAGKSSVGRRLAARLDLPFTDADEEIERAAGCSISEIFARHGEAHFRDGERRVIARLLDDGCQVLATGGGAWMNAETRDRIADKGISVWLKADIKILLRRVRRRNNRPLLSGANMADTMKTLVEERDPVYALADLTVHSREVTHETMVNEILAGLSTLLAAEVPEEQRCP